MANTIRLKRSSLAGKAPAVADLQLGEIAINTTDGKLFLKKNNGGEFIVEVGPVTSVSGKTGVVTLAKADVGLGSVDNTSDAAKPVSTATQTALNGKANTVHSHVISDVANLQTSLDGKASSSHTHTIANITNAGALAAKNTIAAADIDAGAATLAKLDRTGPDNYVLTAKGPGNAPVWQAASSGASALTAGLTRNILSNVYSIDLSAGSTFNGTITRRPSVSDARDYVFETVLNPISFVGSSGTTGSATLTLPAGIQQNDLIILIQGRDNAAPVDPAGWTNLITAAYSATTVGYSACYLVAGATPPTTVAVSTTNTNDAAIAIVYRGVDPLAPIDVVSASAVGIAMPDAPSITPNFNGARVVAIGFIDDDNYVPTAPSGFGNLAYQSGTTAGFTVMSADVLAFKSVSVDPGSFGGAGADDTVAYSLALKPNVSLTETLTLPTGLVEGDTLVLITTYASTPNTIITTPSGWTSLTGTNLGQNGYRFGVFTKVMGSMPDTTVIVSKAPMAAIHRVYVLKGVDQTTLVDVSSIDNTQGFGDTRSLNTTQPYTLYFCGFGSPRLQTNVASTGLEDFDYVEAVAGTSYLHLFTGWANDPKSGSFDVPQVTGTAGAGSNSGSSWAFAFRTIVPRIVFSNEPEKGSAYGCTIDVNFDTNAVIWPYNVTFEGMTALQQDPTFSTINYPGSATVFHLAKTEPLLPFAASGQAAFTTPGTYSWVVPADVTSISAVGVGAGGGGLTASTGGGGAGGDLRYRTMMAVTPGETLTIVVGDAGVTGATPTAGGFTQIRRGSTVLLEAAGGGVGRAAGSGAKNGTSTALGGTVGGGNGGTAPASPAGGATGGGGAGGYAGNGGNSVGTTISAGNAAAIGSGGGGAGGTGGSGSDVSGAGGGVGIFGIGADGVGGAANATTAVGDNGGAGSGGLGPAYGGGGGSSDNAGVVPTGAGTGAARLIWGKTAGGAVRSFPATGTVDHVSGGTTSNLYRAKAYDTYPQAFY